MPGRTRNLLDPSCFSMGALAIDVDDAGLDIYLTLGLKGKGAIGKPRFLCFLSHLLELSIQQNEIASEPALARDVMNVFDGSSAPAISLQQYIESLQILQQRILCQGGSSTAKMNRLEVKFLFSVDFRLKVDVETFRKYCQQLQKESSSCHVDRPVSSCFIKGTWPKNEDSMAHSTTEAR